MYALVLTLRYVRSKVMPLLAALCVALCTMMVLVTWSVMSGFLGMLIGTGRNLAGDVTIAWPGTGFAYAEELVADLERDPLVEAASPMIETFGSLSLPNGQPRGVLIRGIEPASYAKVTKYAESLWWKPLDRPLAKDTAREDPRLGGLGNEAWGRIERAGRTLDRPDPRTGEARPAIVPGIHVTGLNARYAEGFYRPLVMRRKDAAGNVQSVDVFLPFDEGLSLGLTVFPIDSEGRPYEAFTRSFPVANEFHSGLYEVDQSVVFVPLAALQGMLRMSEGLRVAKGGTPGRGAGANPDADPGESFATGTPPAGFERDPARVTHVLVKGRGDTNDPARLKALRERVQTIYAAFAERHEDEVPPAYEIDVLTWEQQNATFINAVKTERTLLLFLFSLISLTAVCLVLAIFWSMVREKTQDIGVLRALGASRAGVAGLWVAYGLAIGLVGAILGMGGSLAIVGNINEIHDWLGRQFNVVVWNPEVYYFTTIPAEVGTASAVLVFIGGVLACGLGALVPAGRAALMRPVAALRNE